MVTSSQRNRKTENQKTVKRILIAFLALAVIVVGVAALYGAFVSDSMFSWKRPHNLGFKTGRLASCRQSPNCVCSQVDLADKEHYIEPIPFRGTTLEAMAAVRRAVMQTERTQIIEEGPNYIYAEFRTKFLRFVDDVEFGFDPGRGVIHVRSASRLGRKDFGVNRARVESLRAAIPTSVPGPGNAPAAGTK